MDEQRNKDAVRRFNAEVIENGDASAFEALMAPGFINHSAPPGMPDGPEGMWNTFQHILRPALSDLKVVIHDQVAEGDKVTTRKTITGVHSGMLMGIPPTGRPVSIDVIDVVRLQEARYAEHWGINTLPSVLAQLRVG